MSQICLPGKNKKPESSKLVVSGWGRTGDGEDPSRMLKVVELDILDQTKCQQKFAVELVGFKDGYKIHDTQLCTYTENKDACQVNSVKAI